MGTIINVLITGSDGQASQSIIKCLRLANQKKKKFRIITLGTDPLLPGVYRGDKGYLINKGWKNFIPTINRICSEENIDIIIPGSDIEIDYLSERREELIKPIILADKKVIRITRDKWLTSLWLKANGFPYPTTYLGIPERLRFPTILKFPLIIKPRKGWGSKNQYKVSRLEELKAVKRLLLSEGYREKDFITQEYLAGEELSGMVFISKSHEILAITCAQSWKKYGMSYKTIHGGEKDFLDFKHLASKITGRMQAIGPLSLQGFKTKNGIKIFEMNPRFTGAQIVRALGGVNGPELLVENWLTGKKEYPVIKEKFIALWYTDYIYLPYSKYSKISKEKRIEFSGEAKKLL